MTNRFEVRSSSQLGTIAVIDTVTHTVERVFSPNETKEAFAFRDYMESAQRRFDASEHTIAALTNLWKSAVN